MSFISDFGLPKKKKKSKRKSSNRRKDKRIARRAWRKLV